MELVKKLLDICESSSVEEALRTSDSWQVLYHLSPVRENLLEWYSFQENAQLLEIGAEAGALTGFFARHTERVVALESDSELMRVNRQRNHDYRNIEYRTGTIDQIPEQKMFDYVALIGGLDRAAEYISQEEPYEKLLRFCNEHLRENGVLILAADNKMGMKYWAGAPEHSSGVPFAGINNASDTNSPFTKDELEEVLNQCGFPNQEFYYPVPDFRFAATLYSDGFLPQRGELRPGNRVYEAGGYQFFEEDLAYDIVCRDRKFPYFADSFLIFAKKNKG